MPLEISSWNLGDLVHCDSWRGSVDRLNISCAVLMSLVFPHICENDQYIRSSMFPKVVCEIVEIAGIIMLPKMAKSFLYFTCFKRYLEVFGCGYF